jgi:DNA polymerase-3 subunit epsilon
MNPPDAVKLLFLDIETTGREPDKHGIHQISGLIDIKGVSQVLFDVHPAIYDDQLYDPEALAIGGKTEEQIKAQRSPADVYGYMYNVFQRYVNRYHKKEYGEIKYTVVGYNLVFDMGFLDVWFKRNKDEMYFCWFNGPKVDLYPTTCFYQSAGLLPKLKNVKQETVCNHFGITYDAHKSNEDIIALRKLYYTYFWLGLNGWPSETKDLFLREPEIHNRFQKQVQEEVLEPALEKEA